jgi:hypothetical protein
MTKMHGVNNVIIIYLQESWMDWSGSTEHVPPLHLLPILCRNLPHGSQIHDLVWNNFRMGLKPGEN